MPHSLNFYVLLSSGPCFLPRGQGYSSFRWMHVNTAICSITKDLITACVFVRCTKKQAHGWREQSARITKISVRETMRMGRFGLSFVLILSASTIPLLSTSSSSSPSSQGDAYICKVHFSFPSSSLKIVHFETKAGRQSYIKRSTKECRIWPC